MDKENIPPTAEAVSTPIANTSTPNNRKTAQPKSTARTTTTPMATTDEPISAIPANTQTTSQQNAQTAPTITAAPPHPPTRSSARLAGKGSTKLATNGKGKTSTKGKAAAKAKTAANCHPQPRPQTPAQQLAAEAAKKAAAAHTNSLPTQESFVRGGTAAIPSNSSNPINRDQETTSSLAPASAAPGIVELTAHEKRIMAICKSDNPLASARAFYLEGVRDEMRHAGLNKKSIAQPRIPQETLDLAAGEILRMAEKVTLQLEEKVRKAEQAREKAHLNASMGEGNQVGSSTGHVSQVNVPTPVNNVGLGSSSAAAMDSKGKGLATEEQQATPESTWILGAHADRPGAKVETDALMTESNADVGVAGGSSGQVNARIPHDTAELETHLASVTDLTRVAPLSKEQGDKKDPASEEEGAKANTNDLASAEIEELVQKILKAVRVIAGTDATPNTLGAEEPQSQAGTSNADVAMGDSDLEAAHTTGNKLKRKADAIEVEGPSGEEPPKKQKAIIALPFRDLVPPMTDLKLKFKGKVFMTIGTDANWTRGYHIPGPHGHGFSTKAPTDSGGSCLFWGYWR
ncbi:hypothetical protein QBC37DRAFT_378545 [Rhypophila decipiens]|uniref:Uncharacterized protein n=1 Tax=Rhypophila decipiens TaxID=261697 RepID=A0AAN6Y0G2_9PEZI|nr:hypothetical protein QBC37DRAFT_378545 [Rhypophila decipiens]